jgi:hypothetical protein
MLAKNKLLILSKIYHKSEIDRRCWDRFERGGYSEWKTCFGCKNFGTAIVFAKRRKLRSKNKTLDRALHYLVKYTRKIRKLFPHKQREAKPHCW